MSTDFDPYRSPSLPEGPVQPVVGRGRPGWLTTLCVLCIVLGALGLINTFVETAGLLAGRYIQAAVKAQPSPGMSKDMQEAQEEFQEEMYSVQLKYWWPLAAGNVLRFGVAALLIVGGVRALGMSEGGRLTLLAACAVALPFELARTILQSVIMLENMTAMNSFAEKLAAEMPQEGPAGMQNFIQIVFRGTMIASAVIMYALALAKIGLYLFGVIYLRRESIKRLFQSTSQGTAAVPPLAPLS